MNNPLINPKNKKAQSQLDAIAKGLNVQPISNISPAYQATTATHYPAQSQYITVTLDKLRPYEHNPRKTRNPNFEMIKESIRRRGLDHKPNITQRPGEPFYIIADGGNTRIQALKELFTETQDQRFWSIECLYKPWKGESADSVEAELDLLIGHLIENDTRSDLTFIEKALGIQQAKEYYEKKLGKNLSSRELSTELENDGYIISHALVTKMERCISYLYPFIPDVLFNGLGHSPIDKLLAIRNNTVAIWQNYQFETDITFDELWANSLSRCNDEEPFSVKIFQDELINEMVAVLDDKVSFEMLYLEIDLDEKKFKKLAQKQQEIERSVTESISDVEQFKKAAQLSTETTEKTVLKSPKVAQSTPSLPETTDLAVSQEYSEEEMPVDEMINILPNISFEDAETENVAKLETIGAESTSTQRDLVHQFESQYGITPGMNVQAQRQQRAEANGLTFACVGRQPVDDIWQIYPARKHKAEAFSLALDIAESVGLTDYVEHVVREPVDYSYKMRPLADSVNDAARFCYTLLCTLQTAEKYADTTEINPEHLLNAQEIDDVVLVKLFRLIRVVRYIRTQGGEL